MLSKRHGETKSLNYQKLGQSPAVGRFAQPLPYLLASAQVQNLLKACVITLNFLSDLKKIEASAPLAPSLSRPSRPLTHSIIQNNPGNLKN